MTDFRISSGEAQEGPLEATSLIEALIHRSDDIAHRFEIISSNLPYRPLGAHLLQEDVSRLVKDLGAATWQRIGDDVPSYAFAEDLGHRYREAEAPVGSLLLHWQIVRRAIHLVLAEHRIRTGRGGEDLLRQVTLMNYTIDWATEASLVGYVMSR